MPKLTCLLALAFALAGCGSDKSVVPDPANPGHCIAVFNWAATMARRSGNHGLAIRSDIRGLYAAHRLSQAERRRAGTDALALLKSGLIRDFDAASALAYRCALPQDTDGEYQRRFPALRAEAEAFERLNRR